MVLQMAPFPATIVMTATSVSFNHTIIFIYAVQYSQSSFGSFHISFEFNFIDVSFLYSTLTRDVIN